jgi:hypothetical protein
MRLLRGGQLRPGSLSLLSFEMLAMIAFLFFNLQEVNLSVLKATAANVNRMTAAEEAHHGTASKNLLELYTAS